MVAMKPLMLMINQSPAYTIKKPAETIHFVASKDKWAYCESRLRKATIMGFDTVRSAIDVLLDELLVVVLGVAAGDWHPELTRWVDFVSHLL